MEVARLFFAYELTCAPNQQVDPQLPAIRPETPLTWFL